MRTNYYFERRSKSLNDWFSGLPTPYDLKKVEESDRRYEQLKNRRL